MLLNPLEPRFRSSAHLAHPGGSAVLQFGVILVLPGSSGLAKCVALAAALNFLASYLGQKCTAATPADEFIDVFNQVYGEDDMRPLGQCLRHTLSVTYVAQQCGLRAGGARHIAEKSPSRAP